MELACRKSNRTRLTRFGLSLCRCDVRVYGLGLSAGGQHMWQPDGWGQTRIGVLTPHGDVVPEAELSALAPDGISIHATRIPFGSYRPGGVMDPTLAADPVRAIADPP